MAKTKKLKSSTSRAAFVVAFSAKAWTPRELPGGVYCSPACGGGCKKTAFNDATRSATVLATILGGGFIPYVWENLGWHYSARQLDRAKRGRLIAEVCPIIGATNAKVKGYRADLYVGGSSFVGRGRRAELALGDAVAKARKASEGIAKDLGKV